MGRIVYVPYEDKVWLDYYLNQAKQTGHGIPGFQGQLYQRGNGLGSFFGRLLRSFLPVAKSFGKSALKTVGREALHMGSEVLNDVAEGQDLGQSVRKRGAKAGKNLLNTASQAIQNQSGGSMGKRPVVSKTVPVPQKRKPATNKKTTKKRKPDIFDDNYVKNY